MLQCSQFKFYWMQRKPKKVAGFGPTILINNHQADPDRPDLDDLNNQVYEHNIYDPSGGTSKTVEKEDSESSFELQNEINSSDHNKENLDKLLDRLGLREHLKIKTTNQELEIVVNNFLQNCVGTVNRSANTEEYDLVYDPLYQQQAKSYIANKGSVYISELSQLQKIRLVDDTGLWFLYRKMRLFLKYSSIVCQKIVQHPLFQAFILIVILLNSLKMATDDPLATTTNLPQVQTAFTVIYVTQMTMKIVAYGFLFNKGAYLRDLWNILDFIIVITSLLPIIIDIGFSVNALRAIRVLRPLRTITKVKALKMIVRTLFHSFSLVMDSLAILFMVMGIFAIAGMQLFGGTLKYRCMVQSTGALSSTLCSSDGDCSAGSICVKGISSPDYSILNFDTIFWSFLAVFQTITCEGWSLIMIYIQEVKGLIYALYSVVIVVTCLYILLNMTMAILKYKYAQVKANTLEEEEEDIQEYEPQFLRKIGIFQDISALSQPAPLIRINHPFRQQVGSSLTLPSQQKLKTMNTRELVAHLDAKISEESVEQVDPNQINLKELRQMGKYQDCKWDVNNLVFETNLLPEKDINTDKNYGKQDSDKSIPDKPEEEDLGSELDDSFCSEITSESEQDEESSRDVEIADRVLEFNKLIKQSVKDLGSVKDLKKLSSESSALKPEDQASPKRELSEFDQLLLLIGSKPGVDRRGSQHIRIPEIDLSEMSADKIYDRFADLGEYRMRRLDKRLNLGELELASKNKLKKEGKRKVALVQEVVEENALDIKQLHLKNELLKLKLKCRIKADELIEQERNYDITRVIVSQKLKELEIKKNQIKDNMNSIHYSVKYRLNKEKSKLEDMEKIYARNLEKEKSILKVPEIKFDRDNSHQDTHENEKENSYKTKDNNHYLRMLQNHQMEEKIDLKLDRIMTTFFKKEHSRRKTLKGDEPTQQEQYESVHEDDILKRHGHLELQYPFATLQQEESLEMINMKNEEYEIHIKGIFGFLRVLRKKLFLFVTHSAYDNFILLIVFLNTTLMALNGYVSTDVSPYSYINQAFTIVFIIDLALKLYAYGIHFFGDGLNLFDAAVVAVSIMQMAMGGDSTTNLSALRSIRILRAFRVLRITRLIRSLSYMKIIMGVVTSIITEFIYVFLLLSLFIFIYTLLGMQIFGGNFPSQSVTGIRQNFDTFFNALFAVFQVMTVQNWNDLEATVFLSSIGTWGIVFLLSWIFLGNWILLNLLQAILLDGFDGDSTNPDEELGDDTEATTLQEQSQSVGQEQSESLLKEDSSTKSKPEVGKENMDSEDASLFIFRADHPLRFFCRKVTNSTVFQVIMFVIILTSSGKLAFDTYVDQDPTAEMQYFSAVANYAFNGIFIVESILKIIAMGFAIGEKAYLSNSWNRLDFGIVCISIIDMSLTGVNLSIFKLLRTLRPLRIITRNEQMKIMVTSLVQSFLGIFNVLIICLCVFLMFAILAMNLLGGKLNFCNQNGSQLQTGNYGPYNIDQATCEAAGGVWTTQLINFQNIGSSMISLYVFSTRQNWPFYVYTFIDSSDSGPVKDNSQVLYFVFAVLFIFIGSLFFMDLLVGVMFMNYHEAQSKIRPKTLSNKQINWQNLQKLIVSEDPCFALYLPPLSNPRKALFNIVSSRYFQIFIAVIILANILVMTISNDDISANSESTLTTLNTVFTYFFMFELLLKIITYGRAYFLSGWNIFDFFVVSASVLDIILQQSGIGSGGTSELSILPQIARIFRVLRITRLLRMIKSFKGLQKLIETFVFSLPAIGKGLMILLLYLFIASILASNLMGSISSDFGGNMNSVINYWTFHNAFETLFVNLTGENWYFYMFFSTQEGFVQCSDGTTTSCVSPLNYLFWLPFVFLGQKVFLQLFVLIVLDQFEANYINENNPLGIFSLYEEDFRDNWIKATNKYHSEKIQSKRLIDLMLALRAPLGLSREETLKKYQEELQSNQKLTEQEITNRVHDLDKKLKKNAARLLHKMNLAKNRIYFGYHETFYNFAKLSTVPQFIDEATPAQRQALQAMHKQSEQALDKVKPKGNLYYYSELQGQDNTNVPLNPISLILFTQIIIKGWHNYSLRNKVNSNKISAIKNQPYDSLNNSCASDLSEAQYQKIANDRKGGLRRGGLMKNRLDNGVRHCELRPTPNMCAAYGQGKRLKHKVSIMKRSKGSLEGLMMKKSSSRMMERDLVRVSKGSGCQ